MFINALLNTSARRSFFKNLRRPTRILDIGCGSGANSRELHRLWPSAEIYGLDICQNSLLPSYIRFAIVDLDEGKLPYPDDFFDVVIFSHVVEHLKRPLAVAVEINRVMCLGGEFYMEAPNWTSAFVPSFGLHREQSNPTNFYDDPTHIRPWTKQALFGFASVDCSLSVCKVGVDCNLLRLPFDFIYFLIVLITGLGRRDLLVRALWNLTAWAIYVHARKT